LELRSLLVSKLLNVDGRAVRVGEDDDVAAGAEEVDFVELDKYGRVAIKVAAAARCGTVIGCDNSYVAGRTATRAAGRPR
jgi:hypothetical protein